MKIKRAALLGGLLVLVFAFLLAWVRSPYKYFLPLTPYAVLPPQWLADDLNARDPQIRARAALKLSTSKRAGETIAALLHAAACDPNPNVRRNALIAVDRVHAQHGVPEQYAKWLSHIIATDPSPLVAKTARYFLWRASDHSPGPANRRGLPAPQVPSAHQVLGAEARPVGER